MKSNFLSIIVLATSLTAFGQDEQTAKDLWNARGTNAENAKKAAAIYGDLATKTSDSVTKAKFLTQQSRMTYFVGSVAATDSLKKQIHDQGKDIAETAINLLKDGSDDETLGLAYYFYGANLGKWGEANGIIASLANWPKLERAMKEVIDLGMDNVEHYGPLRILGRAYFKLPGFAGGSNDKSLKNLKKAYDETFNSATKISYYGLNNLYLADLYFSTDKEAEACRILKTFVAQPVDMLPAEFEDRRIPETKMDLAEAKKTIEKKCN